jgi:hypothetical protein
MSERWPNMGESDECRLTRSVTGADSVVPLTVLSVVLKVGTGSRSLEDSGWKDAGSSWQRGGDASAIVLGIQGGMVVWSQSKVRR